MGSCLGKKEKVNAVTFQAPKKEPVPDEPEEQEKEGEVDLDAMSRRLSTGKATMAAYNFG